MYILIAVSRFLYLPPRGHANGIDIHTTSCDMATTLRKVPTRVIIYPRDVENITGQRPRTVRKMFRSMRLYYGKSAREFITKYEFAEWSGIPLPIIESFLVD